ncbi:hypothetical protein MCOR02_003468 [Pyricularia oryzae]|uniref:Uncharacterized protein n=1 Tax=Pyricularia oryzae TaxID=318829 RepID=A0A4P7N9I2_PYROR|nr:hypothetical protein MCOR02_003468 [Pyricularia oryzae]KAI6335671.1 hypothetical protein MCOR30_003722 [Pyricularia oryzae]KAI6423840.1 hypothetical protein MCOR24_003609 [Pyricularia oryzae]QBZ57666.1 hypothetical protein PoMZ_02600 [Pyricularia oryzae]
MTGTEIPVLKVGGDFKDKQLKFSCERRTRSWSTQFQAPRQMSCSRRELGSAHGNTHLPGLSDIHLSVTAQYHIPQSDCSTAPISSTPTCPPILRCPIRRRLVTSLVCSETPSGQALP